MLALLQPLVLPISSGAHPGSTKQVSSDSSLAVVLAAGSSSASATTMRMKVKAIRLGSAGSDTRMVLEPRPLTTTMPGAGPSHYLE
jgi:hypothetical protein